MAEETWLYLIHKKDGDRVAVRPEHYGAKVEAGYKLDPDYGDQDAPKVTKASDSDHKGADKPKDA